MKKLFLFFFVSCALESQSQFVFVEESPRLHLEGERGRHYELKFFREFEDLDTASSTTYIATGVPEMIGFTYNLSRPLYAQLIPTTSMTELESQNGPPIARYQSMPVYPPSLLLANINGEAVIEFIIRSDGTSSDFSPTSYTHIEFYVSAIAAMENWLFEPAKNNGNPISIRAQIAIPFTIL